MLCKCWNHHINNHHWQVMTHNLQHSDPDHLWMWTGSSDLWKHSHLNFKPSTCDRGRRRSRESLQAADESRNSSRRRGTNTQDHRLSLLTAAVDTLWITLKNINATRDAGCFFLCTQKAVYSQRWSTDLFVHLTGVAQTDGHRCQSLWGWRFFVICGHVSLISDLQLLCCVSRLVKLIQCVKTSMNPVTEARRRDCIYNKCACLQLSCLNLDVREWSRSRILAVRPPPRGLLSLRGNKTVTQSREICVAAVRCSASKHQSPAYCCGARCLPSGPPPLFIFASPPVTERSFITRAGSKQCQNCETFCYIYTKKKYKYLN